MQIVNFLKKSFFLFPVSRSSIAPLCMIIRNFRISEWLASRSCCFTPGTLYSLAHDTYYIIPAFKLY
jgi:hypothetical protein